MTRFGTDVPVFDVHCHLEPDAADAAADGETIAGRLLCGVGPEDWAGIAAVARGWAGTAAAYGLHPWHVGDAGPDWPERLEQRLAADPAAWLGEAGLDGLRTDGADPAAQDRAFREQLRLAARLGRRVNLHCVKAWDGLIAGLDAEYLRDGGGRGFIVHSFAGPHQYIAALRERGAYFSVGPLAARGDSPRRRRRVALLPADRLLLESDAFLRPGRDAVDDLAGVLRWLAEVRGMTVDAMVRALADNTRRLFADG